MSTYRADPRSPWQLEAPTRTPARALQGRYEVDVAVVGAGLAGLSAALYLARAYPAARVAVLEARTVGAGATGRSTGVVGPGVGSGILGLRRRYGNARAAAAFGATLDAVDHTIRLVAEEGIACDLEVTGQLVAAQTRAQARRLRRQAAAFRELGFDVPYLDQAAVYDVLRTDSYLGALRYQPVATVDPYRMCVGLAERALTAGVLLFENSPVQRIEPGPPAVLHCPAGRLLARHVVLATDGYTPELGVLGESVVPIDTHVLRTSPVPDGLLATVGWHGREAVIDSRTFFAYVRLTADNRVVFGGGPVAVRSGNPQRDAAASERTWNRLERELRRLLPALGDIPVTDRWYGTTGSTLDRMPVVGRLAHSPGMWFTGAWCGHGVALSVASGALLAAALDPTASPAGSPAKAGPLPWQRSRAPWLPAGLVRHLGLQAYVLGLDAVDRAGLLADRGLARRLEASPVVLATTKASSRQEGPAITVSDNSELSGR